MTKYALTGTKCGAERQCIDSCVIADSTEEDDTLLVPSP